MAIRILKHGNGKFTRRTCPRCGCEFEFTDEEVRFYTNQIESYATIQCPECNLRIAWERGHKVATPYN